MAVIYSDAEIADLLSEPKSLPTNWRSRVSQFSRASRHSANSVDLTGAQGRMFRLFVRRSRIDLLNFSVILGVINPHSNQIFRLRRYNGKSHEHENKIEKQVFYDFHIHMATERYQSLGFKEDAYAEATIRYASHQEAIECLIKDAYCEDNSNQFRFPLGEV